MEQIKTNSRLRWSALKEGGIVWRLVIQHVVVKDVLANLSQSGTTPALEGLLISDMPAMFDDELTEDEERIVCGVYDASVTSGKFISVRSGELSLTLCCRWIGRHVVELVATAVTLVQKLGECGSVDDVQRSVVLAETGQARTGRAAERVEDTKAVA